MTRNLWILPVMVLLYWRAEVALATILPFEVPAGAASADHFIVTRTGSTDEPVVKASLQAQASILVNFPETGLYRIIFRDGTKIIWREDLLVLLTPPPADQLVRLEWRGDGAGHYRLVFSDEKLRFGTSETPHTRVYVQGERAPWILRIRKRKGNGPVEDLQLALVKRAGFEQSRDITPPPSVNFDPLASDDDQVVAEPEYGELLEGAEGSTTASKGAEPGNLPPLKRQHRVFTWVKVFEEGFRVDRRDRYNSEPSTGVGSGVGGYYYVTPTLQTQLEFDSHVTQTEYEAGGTEPPGQEQSRLRLRLGAGVDVLNLQTRRPSLGLEIGPQVLMIQIPLTEDNQRKTSLGLGVSLSHFDWQLFAEARSFQNQSHELGARWVSPWSRWGIKPFLGLYQRMTRAKSGDVKARFEEKGLRLGLDREF